MSSAKSFLQKYGRAVGEKEILMVQMMANDVPREKMAERLNVKYKALAMRIAKLRKSVGVKSDITLALLFYKNGLID